MSCGSRPCVGHQEKGTSDLELRQELRIGNDRRRRGHRSDAGLRAYMIRVYNYMVAGVGLTGVVAWLTFEAAVAANADGAILQLTSFGRAMFAAM